MNDSPHLPDLRNNLIQITPPHRWGGCYATVTEVKSWGVVAFITVPHPEGTGNAFLRLSWDEFEPMGNPVYFVVEA